MKKIILFFLTASLAVCMLSGCGGSGSSGGTQNTASGSNTASAGTDSQADDTAPAADDTPAALNADELTAGQKVEATGPCGDKATYTLYENNLLVVEGTGAVTEQLYDLARYTYVEKAIIKEGIEEIGEGVFEDDRGMTDVSLPSTLKKIGVNAFK